MAEQVAKVADQSKTSGAEAAAKAPRPSLADALASFRTRKPEEPPTSFPVTTRTFSSTAQLRRAKGAMVAAEERALRKLIRPENASALLPFLPETEHDRAHAIIAGDFVFCDFIMAVVAQLGAPRRLTCATLSLSQKNVEALAGLADTHGCPVQVLVSHYFEKTNANIYAALLAVCERQPLVTVHTARSHCKVTLLDYASAAYVIESSANLRSSRNLEQVSMFNDRALLEFHLDWIAEAIAAHRK